MNKEWMSLVEQVRAQGWQVKETKKGFMMYPPDKSLSGVAVHGSPSDRRASANIRSELRKRGFKETT